MRELAGSREFHILCMFFAGLAVWLCRSFYYVRSVGTIMKFQSILLSGTISDVKTTGIHLRVGYRRKSIASYYILVYYMYVCYMGGICAMRRQAQAG